jgi:glycosyltransferase involved in cell wall biosynthesis/tetratricopeptide (TPR) repeat protein/2-polyprenyl-3-methyl-5-hydroxy-6-metoxy-1,4-benzoquinol methylase
MNLKILSFNWHEPYLCLMAKIGHEFLVIEPEIGPGKIRKWDQNMRPLPKNVRLLSLEAAKEELDQNAVDLIIAHNVKDLIELNDYSLPRILVFHNRLSTEIDLGNGKVDQEEYLAKIQPFLNQVKKVFISESKKQDWGMDGKVILPGIDVPDYDTYNGKTATILRVGNLFKERDLMLGYSASQKVVEGFSRITLGMNPSIPSSRLSKGFQDLKDHYSQCRLYLNTTVEGYEDGYNLAMLEAMATGMPVVSTGNKTSPIENGVNGYISDDIEFLRSSVAELLENPEKARELGLKARETVQQQFSLTAFLKSWTEAIQESIIEFLAATGVSLGDSEKPFHEKPRKNILMNYVSYPVTTAHYLERALRKEHNVITTGAMMTKEIIQKWNLEALNREITPQDIPTDSSATVTHMLSQLPTGWRPDLYLWVETGLGGLPPDLSEHTLPKACYLIDTHIHFERHAKIAEQFDFVFLAQKAYIEPMRAKGCENIFWLPLACDPEIHGRKDLDEKYDVGFVGSVTPAHVRRKRLLDEIGRHFSLHTDRKFMDEMAEVFSQSKIIFNEAINRDLNMRVFEALCSGSLLVTDSAPGSGLEYFFKDNEDLVIFKEENLIERIRYFLEHPEERRRIARQGREEVLARHTYDHRAKSLLTTLDDYFTDNETPREEAGNAPRVEVSKAPGAEANDAPRVEAGTKPDSYFQNVRDDLFPLIPETALTILEIGCAAGFTGRELKKRPGVFVAGVENDPTAARLAREVLDDVVEGNIEEMDLPYSESSFDCILFADVLEHLVDPLSVLKKMRKYLKPEGTVVASIPNVQFMGLINHLVDGNWTYQKEGILDETHLRFFTFKEIEKLFARAGFEIGQVEETLDPQFKELKQGSRTALSIGRMTIKDLTPEEVRRFFVFQYKISARLKVENVQRPEELLAKAKQLEKENNFKSAILVYQQLQGQVPEHADAICGEANCCMHLQDAKRAGVLYEKALSIQPENIPARMGMSSIELQKGNWGTAIEGFFQVLETQQKNDKAWAGLGIAFRQKNMKPQAMDCFIHSLDANVENSLALTNLMELSYEEKKFAECEKVLEKYLKLHPAKLDMLFGLAGIQYKMDKLDEANSALDKILLFDPGHKDALDLRAQVEKENNTVQRQE